MLNSRLMYEKRECWTRSAILRRPWELLHGRLNTVGINGFSPPLPSPPARHNVRAALLIVFPPPPVHSSPRTVVPVRIVELIPCTKETKSNVNSWCSWTAGPPYLSHKMIKCERSKSSKLLFRCPAERMEIAQEHRNKRVISCWHIK